MQKNLVIVESPAKAKTIEKFLGKDYRVMSSYGHIRDLSTKELGIDVAHAFKPQYFGDFFDSGYLGIVGQNPHENRSQDAVDNRTFAFIGRYVYLYSVFGTAFFKRAYNRACLIEFV